MKFRPKRYIFTLVLGIAVMLTGCRERHLGSRDNKPATDDLQSQEMLRQAEMAEQMESRADLVARLLGRRGNEGFSILRINGQAKSGDTIISRIEFEQLLQGVKKSTGLAIVVIPAKGFTMEPVTNIVTLLRANGFGSVRVFAEGWGHKYPVPRTMSP